MEFFQYLSYAVGVAGAAILLTSRTKNENQKDLKDRVEILEKDREVSREQHLQNQKAIAHLEGQLKTYKDIPLQQIADSLRELARTQNAVLMRLDKSAEISEKEARTGGMLVKNKGAEPLEVVDVGN